MKIFVILSALLIPTLARPQTQYGVPKAQSFQFLNSDAISASQSSSNSGHRDMMAMDGPKVYKHISIHIAPPEEFDTPQMKRVIRPMEKPNKVVNIIFIKAPSQSSSRQTEIILPSQPETKTVVYVLLKRPGNNNNVKIRKPKPTTPSNPEVFFIKYGKDVVEQGQGQGEQSSDAITGNATGGKDVGVAEGGNAGGY